MYGILKEQQLFYKYGSNETIPKIYPWSRPSGGK
jgi:hypothetical protein